VLCTCGYKYRNWSTEDLIRMKEMFEKIINERYPNNVKLLKAKGKEK
jgi:hypothetical protein